MDYPDLTPGILIKRYKRFLADVAVDSGDVVTVHCANTGSMRSINVPGCRVWLSHSSDPKRKLAWTWELIELPQPDGTRIVSSVHTGRANGLVAEALGAGRIPELSGYASLKREIRVEEGRLDFYLNDDRLGDAYIEVKQVTLRETDGHGYFPASVTVRGARHVQTLARLAEAGHRAVLMFCVVNDGIEAVAPARHIDPHYADVLIDAVRRGVEVLAYGCRLTWQDGAPQAIRLDRALPVVLDREWQAPVSHQ
ncbi:DNA/RNA nuclease SfsA [Pistricoccus aurantiacus]|uniref:Sugar fermentation stimulation protein homolog n=1 Tax=Pistricoccus aurantiacus TaxID=1883414 RepID=A0A5B8SNG1_9GAMM|nr:DNA/RNA nuclease SfsA [Pistricoccus aurantiacus]QEA38579.1 DNA/RNA nuclease SfsA [Pistricoccus aurantiacus]